MNNNDTIVLNSLSATNNILKLSTNIEQVLSDINATFQTPILAQIPFAEKAALFYMTLVRNVRLTKRTILTKRIKLNRVTKGRNYL